MSELSLNPYKSPQEVDTRSTRRLKPSQPRPKLTGMGRVGLIFIGFIALILLYDLLMILCGVIPTGTSSTSSPPVTVPSP